MFGNTNNSNHLQLQEGTDKKILGWVSDLHGALNKDRINLKELDSLVKALEHMADDAREDYINTLLYPETVFGKKIPTLFPIPTSTFQLHLVGPAIATSSNGHLAWTWNPVFLQDQTIPGWGTFYVNNDTNLTGSASSNQFKLQDIQYNQIPGGLYGNFRVVSASVVVTYIGRMDIVSGVLGIGIGLNNSGVATPQAVATTPPVDAASAIFGNFLQVDNLFFSERTQAANGVRAIYFPIDDRFTNFLTMPTSAGTVPGGFVPGFYFAGYAQGLPQGASSLRFDFYINFEAIVTPQYNNFIPQSTSPSSDFKAIEAASLLTTRNKDKLTTPSSDIPGSNIDISSGGMVAKLAKETTELPNIDVIRKSLYKY